MRRMKPLPVMGEERRAWLLASLGSVAGGKQVWASNEPMRIVAAGGAITETLFELGAQNLLVGVDTTSSFPPDAKRLPGVGYMRSLSAEGVLSLSPSHLFVTEDAGPPAVLRQIGDAGVRVVAIPAQHSFEGVLGRVRQLGELLGKSAQAQAAVAHLQQEWKDVTAQVSAHRTELTKRKGRRPRVLFVLSHTAGQAMVAGRDSAADSMIRYAGMQNAAGGFAGYKPLSAEAAVVAEPDVILTSDLGVQTSGGIDGLLRLPGLSETPAGRLKRVVAMDTLLLLGFGPRLPQAVRQLDEACFAALTAQPRRATG